jgi:negative regulator of genetic competence, sporulation and motility
MEAKQWNPRSDIAKLAEYTATSERSVIYLRSKTSVISSQAVLEKKKGERRKQ